jgi:poly-gamma-glutamate system protein
MTARTSLRYSPWVLLTALLLIANVATAVPRRHPAFSLMLEAAKRQQRAEAVLYARKLALGLYDAELDPNRTGLVGVEYSTITTTLGSLKAKRTATNPDFAAYVVRVLTDHGIGSGDSVLVTMTGSFPGLNLAALVALETLNVSALRVGSLGASSYGANQEEFTWLDIEDTLYRDGMLLYRSDFVTLGGTGDVGGGLPVDSKSFLRHKADSLGYTFLKSRSLKTQSHLRREQLGSPKNYALLINIGGNQAMLGKGKEGRELPGGWIDPASDIWRSDHDHDNDGAPDGIVFDFLAAGVPVLNLLHVEEITTAAGLPFDPSPLPLVGQSRIYFMNGPSAP